jgi:hypothetical protein
VIAVMVCPPRVRFCGAAAETHGAETDPGTAERIGDLARQGLLSPGDRGLSPTGSGC